MVSRASLSSIHHLLGLPLGAAYFTVFVTGFAVGGGLAVIGVGVLILVATLSLARPLGELERRLANVLLGARVPAPPARRRSPGVIAWAKDVVADGRSARSLAYLLARFPLGLVAFMVTAGLLATGVALAAAPVLYRAGDVGLGGWTVDTVGEALLVAPAGVAVLVAAVPVIAGMGRMQGMLARLLLGEGAPAPVAMPRAAAVSA